MQQVKVVELSPRRDLRGGLTEIFRQEWFDGTPPVQWNVVRSNQNVLRGVHVHVTHVDFLVILDGVMQVGIQDLRTGTENRAGRIIEMDGTHPTMLVVPPGVAHGFYFPEPANFVYGLSHYWDPVLDEFGCRWDDPELTIPWPQSISPILSERDKDAVSFADMMTAIRSHRPAL